MIVIAIKKLKGEPIEKLLEKRRKEAYENNIPNQPKGQGGGKTSHKRLINNVSKGLKKNRIRKCQSGGFQ